MRILDLVLLACAAQNGTAPPQPVPPPVLLKSFGSSEGNYRGSPVRDVKVTVPDAKAAKVELLSPEGGDLAARDVEVGADGVRFTVPQVGVYTVAIVG